MGTVVRLRGATIEFFDEGSVDVPQHHQASTSSHVPATTFHKHMLLDLLPEPGCACGPCCVS
jgi:hypothetical protein